MKYYAHNIGDWLPATVDLSCAEEGVYRRLMDWYYSNELPLPLAMRDLYRIARTRSPADRLAVQTIVHRYFTAVEDGWHHDRIDKVLKQYAVGDAVRSSKRELAAERQRRSRAKRTATWAALVSKGIQAPLNAPQHELDALLVRHGVTQIVTRDATRDVARDLTPDRAKNQEPRDKDVTDYAATSRDAAAGDGLGVVVIEPSPTHLRVQSAARALKASGFDMTQANTADPRLIALLQAGVSDDELRLTAAEAMARAKSWGWLVATIAGRHHDVANGFASRRAANGPTARERSRVAGLTPTIAARPPKPDEPESAAAALPF